MKEADSSSMQDGMAANDAEPVRASRAINPALLPAPAWPPEVYPNEPSHGFFLRFAAANKQASAAAYAQALNLNSQDFDLPELLDFCLQFPIRHPERLVDATPVMSGKLVVMNGQSFNRFLDWSTKLPRVCAGCIGEAPYYRNWWDLVAISHCPIHDLPLIRGKESSQIAWWFPIIGETPDGVCLGAKAEAVQESGHPWERYVLGRLGVVSPMHVTNLDKSEMYQLTDAADLLGHTNRFGTPFEAPTRRDGKSHEKRRLAVTRGGATLVAGHVAVSRLIEEHVCAIQETSKARGFRPSHRDLFSGRWAKLRNPHGNDIMIWLRGIVDDAVGRSGIFVIRRRHRPDLITKGLPMTLKALSQKLQLNKDYVLSMAETLGLRRVERGVGRYAAFLPEAVATLEAVVADLVPRAEAADFLGLPKHNFDWLCAAGAFSPFVRLGFGRSKDHFRKSDLLRAVFHHCDEGNKDALVSSATASGSMPVEAGPNHVGAARALYERYILNGDRAGQGRLRCLESLDPRGKIVIGKFRPRATSAVDGLSKSDVASMLGVATGDIAVLIRIGELKVLSPVVKKKPRIDSESVAQFTARYVVASSFAETLRCPLRNAIGMLEARGVRRVEGLGTIAIFVRRSGVESLLGLADKVVDTEVGAFWRELAVYLKRVRSCMRVFRGDNRFGARLLAATNRLRVHVQLGVSMECITYEVRCDPTKSPGRYAALAGQLSDLSEKWPELVVTRSSQDGSITVSETWVADLSNRQEWSEVFCWLDRRVMLLRSIFSRTHETTKSGGL